MIRVFFFKLGLLTMNLSPVLLRDAEKNFSHWVQNQVDGALFLSHRTFWVVCYDTEQKLIVSSVYIIYFLILGSIISNPVIYCHSSELVSYMVRICRNNETVHFIISTIHQSGTIWSWYSQRRNLIDQQPSSARWIMFLVFCKRRSGPLILKLVSPFQKTVRTDLKWISTGNPTELRLVRDKYRLLGTPYGQH